jgi:hypothetical protein
MTVPIILNAIRWLSGKSRLFSQILRQLHLKKKDKYNVPWLEREVERLAKYKG